MKNGLPSGEQPKKKRGRPPGTRRTAQFIAQEVAAEYVTSDAASQQPVEQDDLLAERSANGHAEAKQTPFSSFLRSILLHDRAELTRVARELEVAENTVYRWINGSSDHPRLIHLKKLPDVMPGYRVQLTNVINQTFGGLLVPPQAGLGPIPQDIYQRVLELNATHDDDESRFWHISQAIFETALEHMDGNHMGMAITYAKLMPQHDDGIHSLREVSMRGHDPWPTSSDTSKAYLGSTTLAGTVAVMQRMQYWTSSDRYNRIQVEVDDFEQSACAAPVMRGTHIAGVLIVSSTQPDFFQDASAQNAVAEYALLINVGLSTLDFYPFSSLHLRPMASLNWQREQLSRSYVERIITYARKHAMSRREAKSCVQSEMELEFEDRASTH